MALILPALLWHQPETPSGCDFSIEGDHSLYRSTDGIQIDVQTVIILPAGDCEHLLGQLQAHPDQKMDVILRSGLNEIPGTLIGLRSGAGGYQKLGFTTGAKIFDDTDWIGDWDMFSRSDLNQVIANVSLSVKELLLEFETRVVYTSDAILDHQLRATAGGAGINHLTSDPVLDDEIDIVNIVTLVDSPENFPKKAPADHKWSVSASPSSVEFAGYFDGEWLGQESTSPISDELIEFGLYSEEESKQPIELHFRLEQTVDPTFILPMLDFTARIADDGILERPLIFPIGQAAQLSCPRAEGTSLYYLVQDGGTLSVSNSTVIGDACKIVIDPERVREVLADRHNLRYTVYRSQSPRKRKKTAQSKVVEKFFTKLELGSGGSDWRTLRKLLNIAEVCGLSQEDIHLAFQYYCNLITPEGTQGRPCLIPPDIGELEKIGRLLDLYGTQDMKIRITDEATGESVELEKTIMLETEQVIEIPFAFPSDSVSPTDVFRIEWVSSEGEVVLIALARPRGYFGLPAASHGKSVRVYVTVPISLVGLRLPASGRDLESSSQSRYLGVSSFSTGAMFVVEPWNYNIGKNLIAALPIYFASGFLFSLVGSEGVGRPQFLMGGGISFPLVQGSSHLDTSIAIGFHYGMDLGQRHPAAEGSHFLITFGANVLSLFGARSTRR